MSSLAERSLRILKDRIARDPVEYKKSRKFLLERQNEEYPMNPAPEEYELAREIRQKRK
ncbi:hypothetical protein HN832_01125 [archaeon]|jgi:hypothetical protein|nr:hypothetical protein [archaeon]MBT4373814.1 hypothetical protein [archaeon]MBT4532280.1 hypothetical protein [archaeon]MBT7001105.1 hypothetical protein [archaeon]MBT7281994.1 hypothetical protein [archaeon]